MRRLFLAAIAVVLLLPTISSAQRQQTFEGPPMKLQSSHNAQPVSIRIPAHRDIADIQVQIRHTRPNCANTGHTEWRTLPPTGESSLGWARRGTISQTADGDNIVVVGNIYSWLGACDREGRIVVITR